VDGWPSEPVRATPGPPRVWHFPRAREDGGGRRNIKGFGSISPPATAYSLQQHHRMDERIVSDEDATSPELNIPDFNTRVAGIEKNIKEWASKPITFEFDPSGTHLFSMMELTRSYTKRCVDLAASIRLLLAQDRIVPATVMARALIETIGIACLFLNDMGRLIAAGDRTRVDARLERFYKGFRGRSVQPINVMYGIRYLGQIDKEYVEYLDKKYGVFTRFVELLRQSDEKFEDIEFQEALSIVKSYDDLSEISHPNGAATQLLYPDPSNENATVERVRARFRYASMVAIWHCRHLITALENSIDLPERYRAAFIASVQPP
jgi:hypothetical protein